jgi:hypothetical protein
MCQKILQCHEFASQHFGRVQQVFGVASFDFGKHLRQEIIVADLQMSVFPNVAAPPN